MKKIFVIFIIAILGIYISLGNVFAGLNVTGVVGNLNSAPTVVSLIPSATLQLLAKQSLQNFVLQVRDNEKDTISYTITVPTGSGSATPISGILLPGDFDSQKQANINFTYLAPNVVGNSTMTITLNDGINLTVYSVDLYIY